MPEAQDRSSSSIPDVPWPFPARLSGRFTRLVWRHAQMSYCRAGPSRTRSGHAGLGIPAMPPIRSPQEPRLADGAATDRGSSSGHGAPAGCERRRARSHLAIAAGSMAWRRSRARTGAKPTTAKASSARPASRFLQLHPTSPLALTSLDVKSDIPRSEMGCGSPISPTNSPSWSALTNAIMTQDPS